MATTIEEILRTAKQAGASDVHITVGIPPQMRVNGNLITMAYPCLMPSDTLEMVLNIMSESQREKFEERGEYDMSFSVPEMGRCRLNVYKQKGLAALAVRLVDMEVKSAIELGVPESVIELYQRRKGLVLVTGPAGSGKSTTLAAILDKINTCRDAHILTLEDPVEYLHRHKKSMVNQREIGLDSVSYASALRAAMREDPDVILVGEMQDYETVNAAVEAAEAGCLVLSAFHTTCAQSTVDRLVDVFPPYRQQQIRIRLSGVLEAVISQQLIPAADGEGRVAAFEVMHASHDIRNLIREGKTQQIEAAMRSSRKAGMMTMDDAIRQLYADGKISMQSAVLFAQDPDGMDLGQA